jgi:hypothetical protein
VIIHNHTTQANGYVAWAPKRMEIYPTPEQNTIPLDQNRQLALHELTHVLQMLSLNTGFSKGMSVLFGQQFPGAVASLLPPWYMEGEAVFAESVLTSSGRGRSPSFSKELKALTIEKGFPYKYDKLINGSYRNFTPNHYQFGYQMVTWSVAGNNLQLWEKVLKTTANIPFSINPVNISLSRNAGLTKKSLFYQTFDSLKTLWHKDITNSGAKKYDPANPSKKKEYINYYSPRFAGTDSLVAIKTSLIDPPRFVLINTVSGKEKKIFTPGSIYPWFISSARGKLVWVENRKDPRWENVNYSVIRLLDIRSGLVRQLTFSSRYLASSLSPDAEKIAASENTTDNKNSLVLVSPYDGSVIEKIPSPGNAFLQHPEWSADGEKITVIYLTEEGEGIMAYDIGKKEWNKFLEPGANDLQSAFLRNDSLFFVSSVSGTDDAYLFTPEKKYFKITRTEFGAADIEIKGKRVMFTSYTSSGNDICLTGIENATEYNSEVHKSSFLIDRFDLNKRNDNNNTGVPYNPEPYKKWKHLFGFHSWMPVYADIEAIQTDPTLIRPGFTLLSQNHLSTLISSLGYEYSADKRHLFHSKVTWKGWYPVIESRFSYNTAQNVSKTNESMSVFPRVIKPGFTLNNSISLPLNFTSGKFYHNFSPSLTVNYVNKYLYVKEKNLYDYGQTQITGRIYFSNYSISSQRDIYPRWAQVFDLSFTGAPFDDLLYGTDFTLKTAFYFPGFLKNQSLRFRFETERQDFAKYLTGNRLSFPRGYTNIISQELKSFSTELASPLLYPDLSISSLLYITRIRTNLFFDYAAGTNNYYLNEVNGILSVGSNNTGTEYFSSYGFELLSDLHILRIPFPVTAGIQAGWKDSERSPSLKFIFSVDIYGMNIGGFRH